jgi:magnesium-transporting ATPase (P-type)
MVTFFYFILDNFVTILRAVKEGRGIFANIQKFAVHLLSGNVSEVITLIIGLALRDSKNQSVLPMVFYFKIDCSLQFKFYG